MGWLEWLGFISGVLCVFLITKQNVWNWSIGLVNSVVLMAVFFYTKLYAQAILQLIYTIQGVYGWHMWLKKDKQQMPIVKIRHITLKETALWGIIGIVATWVLSLYFATTGDPAPLLDSFITVFSLIANYFICLKIFQNWFMFFGLDILSVGLYISQGIWITAGTYVVFMILCYMGIKDWYKDLKRKE